MLELEVSRPNRTRISGIPVWLAPAEYVILWKLEFLREGGGEKHARDIRGMLAVSPDEIDRTFLDQDATRLGLTRFWRNVCPDAPGPPSEP